MTTQPLTKREKSVRRHSFATGLAFLAFTFVVLSAAVKISGAEVVRPAAYLVLVVSLVVMFITRNADEYVASLWKSGTSLAFMMVVALIVFGPGLEGFFDGLTGNESGYDLRAGDNAMLIVLGSFFVANLWTRLRGSE